MKDAFVKIGLLWSLEDDDAGNWSNPGFPLDITNLTIETKNGIEVYDLLNNTPDNVTGLCDALNTGDSDSSFFWFTPVDDTTILIQSGTRPTSGLISISFDDATLGTLEYLDAAFSESPSQLSTLQQGQYLEQLMLRREITSLKKVTNSNSAKLTIIQNNTSRGGTGALTQVSSSATSVLLLASNQNRTNIDITNTNTTDILYIAKTSTATTSNYTYSIAPGETKEIANFTGALNGIWAGTTDNGCNITETTI